MKVLRFVIYGEEAPHYTITKAFEAAFDEVETVYWQEWENDIPLLNKGLKYKLENEHYDMVFMQIQRGGVLEPQTLEYASKRIPIFNWTGDVRNDVHYYTPIGNQCITLFSNNDDPVTMRNMGFRSDYLQTGYDHKEYFYESKPRENKIIFLGNNYDHNYFSQSTVRVEMVKHLYKHFGDRFVVYGRNWDFLNRNIRHTESKWEERHLLNTHLLAVNIPHINCSRYYSDRKLRAMACGACVLSQEYQDYQHEFTDAKNVVMWKDFNDLVQKASYYLNNPEKAVEIGKNAHTLVEKVANWDYRVQELKLLYEKYK